MVITVRDIVAKCYDDDDGQQLHDVLAPLLLAGERVEVSFKGVDVVPSSFVNAAFIVLLDVMSFAGIKQHLTFTDSTRQINHMIKTRFAFESTRHASLADAMPDGVAANPSL